MPNSILCLAQRGGPATGPGSDVGLLLRWAGGKGGRQRGCPVLSSAPSGNFQATCRANDRVFSRVLAQCPVFSQWWPSHTASPGGVTHCPWQAFPLGGKGVSPCLHCLRWKLRPRWGHSLSLETLTSTGRQRPGPWGGQPVAPSPASGPKGSMAPSLGSAVLPLAPTSEIPSSLAPHSWW